jgi:peptidoglycan/xylan/chitin deacetylase (PgdA/CDA1 family)
MEISMSVQAGHGETAHVISDVPVLMYHSISTGEVARQFRRFVTDPAAFTAQMDYLAAEGYRPVTAADLAASWLSGRPLPPRPVVLTFDDAYADFHTTALPILRDHGFPATLYVPTAFVGACAAWMSRFGEGDRPILSWQALGEIAAEGVEVASHSHSHPQMDRLPPAVVREEVRRSRALLQDHLGIPVEGFAYPFGYWNRAARTALASAGFCYAVQVADLMTTADDDMFTLPRLTVNAGIGARRFACLLDARTTATRRLSAVGKRFLWQALRRTVPAMGGDPRVGWPG